MGTGVKKVSLNDFCEVIEFNEAGYAPIVDFQSWRVAMLNYIDELEPNQINNFQCHLETDEVFVLLAGHCILFLAEVAENRQIITIHAVDMEPHRAYNIKQGIFHTHTLTQDAKVLIIENRDTSDLNSPKIMIDQTINEQL
ncbi:MAG: hypothetical protein IAF02_19405, partial [Anaerolineae bacterium]|nr:hypothetical protein [Anaerolineae bacterium]